MPKTLPPTCYAQVQLQMLVMDCAEALVLYHTVEHTRVFRVGYNKAWVGDMLRLLRRVQLGVLDAPKTDQAFGQLNGYTELLLKTRDLCQCIKADQDDVPSIIDSTNSRRFLDA